jgi:hypothetical protein
MSYVPVWCMIYDMDREIDKVAEQIEREERV